MNFLMGLNESFSQSRGQILLMDPLPSINRVFSLMAQEEKQKSISNETQNSMAFLAKSSVPSRKPQSNNYKSTNRDRPYCTHCNFQGHTVDKCYKLHGYPPGYKSNSAKNYNPRNKINYLAAANEDPNAQISSINHDLANMFKGFSPDQCQQVLFALSNHMITVNHNEETTTGKCYSLSINSGQKSHTWIIDSGATQHVCHEISMFMNKRKVSHYTVTLPNKITLPVTIIGDIKIDHLFTLKDVLYVPSFDQNLISVSALTQNQKLMIQFTCNHALIQDMRNMKMIGKANIHQRLYVLDEGKELKNSRINNVIVSLDVWHNRLGHHSNKCLYLIRD